MKTIFSLLVLLSFPFVYSQNNVTLRRSFVDSLCNKVSISGKYIVDKAHAHPNASEADGDLHVAGRNKQLGIPSVAEIMNAILFSSAVDLIHNVEGTTDGVIMTGVWRLW